MMVLKLASVNLNSVVGRLHIYAAIYAAIMQFASDLMQNVTMTLTIQHLDFM